MSRIALVLILVLGTACGRSVERPAPHEDHAADADRETAQERGPRGGRVFRDEFVRLELRIEESGIPPEFRVYLYEPAGGPIARVDGDLRVILTRFGGRQDSIAFRAVGDHFRSTRSVEEPHSFDARIVLDRGGKTHVWTFEQREGRIELAPEAIAQSGITAEVAGPRRIRVRVETPGEIRLNAERVVQIQPRFAGVVRSLSPRLGDTVRAGDLLATVQSNESLTEYEIRAPLAGTVVARDVVVGQAVDHESVLFTIADLRTVWADFALYPQAAGRVRRGQRAEIRAAAGEPHSAEGTVSYVGPLLEQDTRVSYGRVVLVNRDGAWQPGLYVTASITVDEAEVGVAVPEDAIVRMSAGPAVFRVNGSSYEVQPVVPGRSDGTWTEILSGLEPGARVVAHNAFLLKSELGKSEAHHDH